MKNLLFISLFSLISFASFSQHSKITVSEDFKIVEKEYQDETIGHSVYFNNNFYTVTNSGVSARKGAFSKLYDMSFAMTVSKYDKNMNKLKDLELENGEKTFGPLIPRMLLLNNKLCLVFFQKNDDKASFSLYLAPVDETSLTMGEKKKICTIQQENVGIFKIESIINAGLVFFANSPDNLKTLIACKASQNNMLTFIIDNNLNILKQGSIHTDNTGYDITSAILTNDNLECIVLDSQNHAKLVCSSVDGKNSELKLNASANLTPYHTRANLANDGKSIWIYSTSAIMEREDKSCNGFMISQLDCSSLKLSKSQLYEFDQEFLSMNYERGVGYKHKKEFFIHNFIPRLIEMDNGSLVIVGSPEYTSVNVSTRFSSMNINSTATHEVATTTTETGPVFAFFPKKNDKTFDYVLVPRKLTFSLGQSSGSGAIQIVSSPNFSTSYAGYSAVKLGSDIVIIYNDGEKNMKRGDAEKIAETSSPKDIILAEALINKDKKLEYRKQIGNGTDSRYTYYLGNTIPLTGTSMLFPIGKQGLGFNERKTYFTNWCLLTLQL